MSTSMVDQLNILLANTAIEQHKLQSYHWYVKGPQFFQAHAKLEEFYSYFQDMVDDIAEIILMEGGKPVSSAKEFLAHATVSERADEFASLDEVFDGVISEFEAFLSEVKELKAKADEEGDYLVSAKMDGYIENFMKSLWMMRQMRMN